MPSPFTRLPPASTDPVFAIAQEAKDAGSGVIDATVGVILDEEGGPLVLPSVRCALEECARTFAQGDFAYPPLLGLPAFRSCVTELIFGSADDAIASIATTGGTGAVALNLKLIKLLGIKEVILPVPSWPNHRRLLNALGLAIREVPHAQNGKATLHGVQEALQASTDPCAVLLQVCGHNTTGLDVDLDEWRSLAALLRNKGHVLLLDLAYQGLVCGVEEDAAPVRLLRDAGVPLLVAWSASKNHSIYGLRTGLACAVADDRKQKEALERHFMILTREMHSAASVTGQQVVTCVQQGHADQWRADLTELRQVLIRKRQRLREAVPSWTQALAGAGLYALLPCSAGQIAALKKRKIFLLPDGRVNIGGIPLGRLEEFCSLVRSVLQSA